MLTVKDQPGRYTHQRSPLERMPKLMGIMFCLGSAMKYASRAGQKPTEPASEEFKKTAHYFEILRDTYGVGHVEVERILKMCEIFESEDFSSDTLLARIEIAVGITENTATWLQDYKKSIFKEDQLEEYRKCTQDKDYFIAKYCNVKSADQPVELSTPYVSDSKDSTAPEVGQEAQATWDFLTAAAGL